LDRRRADDCALDRYRIELVALFVRFVEEKMIGADARMVNEWCGIEDVKVILNVSTGDWDVGRRGPDCAAVAVEHEGEAAPDEVGDQECRVVKARDV
jgi:hypothetical protein